MIDQMNNFSLGGRKTPTILLSDFSSTWRLVGSQWTEGQSTPSGTNTFNFSDSSPTRQFQKRIKNWNRIKRQSVEGYYFPQQQEPRVPPRASLPKEEVEAELRASPRQYPLGNLPIPILRPELVVVVEAAAGTPTLPSRAPPPYPKLNFFGSRSEVSGRVIKGQRIQLKIGARRDRERVKYL